MNKADAHAIAATKWMNRSINAIRATEEAQEAHPSRTVTRAIEAGCDPDFMTLAHNSMAHLLYLEKE